MSTTESPKPFDIGTVDEIVVSPLRFDGAAPNRRKASFNGNPPKSSTFVADQALTWVSPASYFARGRVLHHSENGRRRGCGTASG